MNTKTRKTEREIIMKKKQIITTVFATAIVASAVFTVAVGNTTTVQAKGNNDDKTVLRIAAQPYPLYSSVWVAHDLGYLDEELNAVNAEYTWTEFQSGPLVNEAVAAGEADLGFMADLPAIIAKSTGQEIEIVSNVAYGEKAIAVLVSPDSDIKSVADLKGKKVAYATGSYAQHLLALLLDQEGLSLKDVESVNLGAGDQPAALANGQVDALVIWEQYISKLTTDGTAKVLADGTGIKRGNMVNYAVSSYAEEHPDVIEAYIRALDAITRINLQDQLLDIWEKEPITMILVTHDIDEAIYLGNKVVVMTPRPGRIRNIRKIDLGVPRRRTGANFAEIKDELYKEFFKEADVPFSYSI